MSYLLDTNVLSEARKSRGDAGVKTWFASVKGYELFISVLVIGEIRQGIERLRPRDPVQAQVFESWLETLKRDYRERILPITVAVGEAWGSLNAAGPLPVIDGLLAATAQVHGLTLVTRNVIDLERTGVSVLNPFSRR
ncbi:MAG: type II toxin-antitoxin system VapC family toxin [Truepera sp.]|nr:type II toxin-antitoxin system VapC family toxin [Truepera sp.]